MPEAIQKRQVGVLDGTPDKRLFWSIISDYDTATALCELVDNAVDLWILAESRNKLLVSLQLDSERQLITVEDTAGGVRYEDLRVLVAPGGSNNDPDAATIGIFGVGGKRAVVALAETASIRTRPIGSNTFEIEITKDWQESRDWSIPSYEVPNIAEGTTKISLSALRKPFSDTFADDFLTRCGETYARFLKKGNLNIEVNGRKARPHFFENWAYPTKHQPREAVLNIDIPNGGKVSATVTAGLIRDRDPASENYGVYFYCNNRLIAKHVKEREVGYFISSEAGVPHPDASLCRVVVRLNGPARLMPWNSSKTGINFSHAVFNALRPTLIPLVSHYSSLSRRLKHTWNSSVFRHETGTIQSIDAAEPAIGRRVLLPELPKVNKSHVEQLIAQNKSKIKSAPWTLGLVEAVAAVDVVARQRLQTKNRISLILLDSNFEIALKEFSVHRPDLYPKGRYTDSRLKQLFENRENVIAEVSGKISVPDDLLGLARHYYGLRNKLIHERATVDVIDADIENYRDAIQNVLKILFDLDV